MESDRPAQISKNAQKKAVKAARYAEQKLKRRAREKEAKKEKKKLRAEKRAAGELDDDEEQKARRKRPKVNQKYAFGGRIVVDLGFDDMMTEKEVVSLTSQLAYTYSANRKSLKPFSKILFTSLNGRALTRLESMNEGGYKRWSATEWWQDGYDRLWADGKGDVQKSVVYLTADADEELLELKEDETYIIGGICDHNRYKNLCLDKAKETGIRAARLPIGRYLAELSTRKVLTVNQVVEILLKWVETQSWEEALYAVVPKRKFQTGGEGKDAENDTENDDNEKTPPEVEAPEAPE